MCMMMDEQFLGIALNRCIALLAEHVRLLGRQRALGCLGEIPKN